MKRILTFLAMLLASLATLHASDAEAGNGLCNSNVAVERLPSAATSAQSYFTTIQREILAAKSPPPVAAEFSFDAPAGPQFSEAEKEAQRERGRQVMPMIQKAFGNGEREVRIAPGDYRFGQERKVGGENHLPVAF